VTTELPEPWGAALGEKGVHSYRDLAERIGGSPAKAHRLVRGGGVSDATIQKVADEFFGGDADRVQKLRGSSLKLYGPWKPPDAAHLLNPDQRRALSAFIKAMVPEEAATQVQVNTRRRGKKPQPEEPEQAPLAEDGSSQSR